MFWVYFNVTFSYGITGEKLQNAAVRIAYIRVENGTQIIPHTKNDCQLISHETIIFVGRLTCVL
jgi:hypothetical protein